RADSEAMTGRIFDRLIAHYGKDAIFRDIDDIPPGIDFRVHINQTLLKTHILLAIVGPQWLGMATDGSAERVQEENDAVPAELEGFCLPQRRQGRYRPGLRLPHGPAHPLHGCDPRTGAEVAAEPRN